MRTALAAMAVLAAVLSPRVAQAESDWAISLYGGQWIGASNDAMMSLEVADTYLAGLGVIYEFEQSGPHVRWEVEGQILQHFGLQHPTEFVLDIAVRWVTYPWDKWIDTSVALGAGLSYTTELPEFEAKQNPDTGATQLLHYLAFEIAVAPPGESHWSLVFRLHHRSGVWGLFDGVGSASNFAVIGIRYRF
jgi:hypothetical protein